ncbi:septum formation family protein [Psychrobacter sp. I-STPA6b]|uniref:septum formation family protein n=1 Tax=Psychrobacter sp. I-STPA6b TaxID=2585718 RepID=UPI001D0C2756|nr:septum formation family protein [Psychrobacter sp. I-STPA6b]
MTAILSISILATGCSESQKEQAVETLGLDQEDVFSLKVGMCFNDPSDSDIYTEDQVSSVPVRDCTKPHDYEIFYTFNLTNQTLPDDETLEEEAFEKCTQAFQQYIGKSYEDSIYEMSYLHPTEESWQADDREVACFLVDAEGKKLTQSLKGSNQ